MANKAGMDQVGTSLVLPRMRPLSVAMALMALAGCAVGPDFERPQAPAVKTMAQDMPATTASDAAHGIDAQTFTGDPAQLHDWWRQFGSDSLNALVDQALKNNPSIEAAEAGLRSAHEYVAAQKGFFYPTVGVSYNFQRQQQSGNTGGNSPGPQGSGANLQPVAPAAPLIYNFQTASVDVGWTPDLFGANRRATEALVAAEDAQRYQLAATRASLVANVVGAALQEASLRDQIQAQQQVIDINARTLDILRKQQQLGYAAGTDVAAQEAALAQAQQLLPPLQKQLAQTRDLLRALVGNQPDQDVSAQFSLSDLHLPLQLPPTVPADLVNNRPDVRMAEAAWHAASAQVGVAQAARFPQITLGASYGGNAAVFNQMFETGGPFWSLIGGVSAPVFQGGTLLHRKRAAEETMTQAGALYRSALITAFQNVSDSLQAVRYDADGMIYAANSERAAKRSLDIASKQFALGYISYLSLLQAQQTWQQAVMVRVQAQALRLGDTAAFYLALGGGALTD